MEQDLLRMQELAGLKEAELNTPNPEVNDLVKQIINVMGYNPSKLSIGKSLGYYTINLPSSGLTVDEITKLTKILPEDSSIGYYLNYQTGLSIRTPFEF